MKTLSKDIATRRAEIIAELDEAENKVIAAIEAFNRDVTAHRTLIEAAVSAYNAVIEDAERLKFDAQASVQDYLDGKPEKWQESAKGLAYANWADDFDSLYLGTVAVEFPAEMEVPDLEARGVLENEWPELYTE